MLVASAMLFLLVVGLFLATLFVPNFGRRLSVRSWIVGGGLALPLPILFALTFYAFWQGEYLLRGGAERPGDTVRIEAQATRWAWVFRYPDSSQAMATEDVLHIPAGATIEIAVTSDDVIHSLWIPRLGGKIDAIPGHTTFLRIRADRPGRFGGQCAEYCGVGHAGMRFVVEAHTKEDYAAAITRQETK